MSSPDRQQIAASLEEFIRRRFRVTERDPERFNHEINLWEAGYVDSLGTVEVISFLESRFAIVMPANTLFVEENTTIGGLASVVEAQLAAKR